MGLFSTLGLKGVLLAALFVGLGGWGTLKTYQVSSARADAVQARVERDEAAQARDKALAVNAANQDTIAALTREKADIQAALNGLEADRKKNQAVINNLSAAIRAGASNPENQVKLSPVLRATVDAIQKQRAARSAK